MGRMDPTPHVGMLNRMSNLKEVILTNVGINVNFICSLSFQSDPLSCDMGFCLNNCLTHKGWVYLFPHTHKTKTKRIITNPKKSIEKTKRKEKIKPTIIKRDK
jgi:hypothetical protein